MRKDRRWADRYINASRPVQYDDEGRAHYMDEDDDDDTVEMYDPHAVSYTHLTLPTKRIV